MFIIVTKYLIPRAYRGLTVFPFIIISDVSDKQNEILINHERIHIRQQLELLVIPFFIWYFLDYLIKLYRYKNRSKAYRNIIFEKEAYANENDLDYLKTRSFLGFLNYSGSK